MIKKLNRMGNSKGVIIDKTILELLGIDEKIEIYLEDNKLIIKKPITENANTKEKE